MIRFLMLSDGPKGLEGLKKGLLKHTGVVVDMAVTFDEAMASIGKDMPDLVIVDESVTGIPGKKVIEDMIRKNPLINTALVSSLSDEDFHEDTEGLGVLMPIRKDDAEAQAKEMIERVEKILSLYR